MRRKIIAGNWKMYKSQAETLSFLQTLAKGKIPKVEVELVLAAQSPLLLPMLQELKKLGLEKRVSIASQNVHWEMQGAFTGELSIALAKEMGATYTLVGHSERRQFFGESVESAAKRAISAHKNLLAPIFCIGESRSERESGKMEKVLREQCAPLFTQAPESLDGFIVAYEPVWAIGTGLTATAAQAQEAQALVRQIFAEHWGEGAAAMLPILYGGSVKPDNAAQLLAGEDVDGLLIGGASLDAASFLAIAAAAEEC